MDRLRKKIFQGKSFSLHGLMCPFDMSMCPHGGEAGCNKQRNDVLLLPLWYHRDKVEIT